MQAQRGHILPNFNLKKNCSLLVCQVFISVYCCLLGVGVKFQEKILGPFRNFRRGRRPVPGKLNVLNDCEHLKHTEERMFPYQPFLGSLICGLAPKLSSCSTTPAQPRPDATIRAVAWVSEC